jgi:hypothetical protein
MKEWVPANKGGLAWFYGDSLLYFDDAEEGGVWKGSLRGYTVIVETEMRRAAEKLQAMEDDPEIN